MRVNATTMPDHIRRLLPPDEKRRLGRDGQTTDELVGLQAAQWERELQSQMVGLLRQRGIEVGWSRTDRRSTYTEGWPDLTFCYRGKPIAVEVKLPGNNPTVEQTCCHERMIDNGWMVYVCRSIPELKEILDACL